ncbi:MAG: PAS domain S-box protein [Chitinophagaceae bacterium]|nr:PAS domain S-box protein [Chitinophagaceae bacterium]
MNNAPNKSDNRHYSGNQFLQDDEARFFLASIVDSLQDSIVSVNLHGVITSWNKGAELAYGYPASEIIGKSLDMVTFPEDFAELLKNIDKIRAGEQIGLYHTVRIHRDGRYMNMDITLSPIKNETGEVIGISTVARDVTVVHQIQEALKKSEGRLRAIVDAAVDFGIIILNEEGKIVDWNKGAEILFGYKKDEVLGRDSSLLFTPEDRHADIASSELQRARDTGRAIDERWHLHQNGSRFFMSGVMTPILYDSVAGFVKIARDITDRKLAEEALMQSEQRKLLAVKSAEMGEWEWQLSTRLIRISEQVTLLFGFEDHSPEVTPEQLLQQIYPDDQQLVREQVIAASNGLQILQTECRIVRADNGQIRWLNIYGRVVMQTDNRPAKLIGVFYDITQRKILEKQKDDFISIASHELKTPVTAINSYAELLAESLAAGGHSYQVNLANKLSEQVNRLTELIRNLLDTSQLSEGGFKLSLQPTDIKELILEQKEALEQIGVNHHFTWNLHAVPLLQADRKRIVQVIMNLVTNAVKYSPERTEIIVETTDRGDHAHICVTDKGMGIPPEEQRFVFERYYRTRESLQEKGFGLGLYICSEIIRQHRGSMGLKSAPGEGSSFYFTLPYG